MGRIVLFERGDLGGVFIGAGGVRPIPRFAAPVLAHLRAISDLLRAASGQTPQQSQDLV
jgi:hypothetical protein